MQKTFRAALLASAMLAVATTAAPASAQMFAGLALGRADIDTNTRGLTSPTGSDSSSSLKLTVGYQFDENLLAGFDYIQWGSTNVTSGAANNRVTSKVSATSYVPWVGYIVPVTALDNYGTFSIVPRVGLALTSAKSEGDGRSISDDNNELMLGFAFEWEVLANVNVGLGYEGAADTGDMYTLGVRYGF